MLNYDVVVIGGGTAGCAAAYISGKLGLKTLIIEKGTCLGGSITSGLVIPVMMSGNNQINTDFYTTLISELSNFGGQITYQGNKGWFNPEIMKIVLDKIMNDVGVDVRFYSQVYNVEIELNTIRKLYINKETLSPYNYAIDTDNNLNLNQRLLVPIVARYIIDSTGNCEFSKFINCKFLEDNIEYQPMNLRFMMDGVDVKTFANWLLNIDSDRSVTTVEEIDGVTHLSTAYTWDTDKHWALAPYFDKAVANNDLLDSDRNYFQVFTVAGMSNSIAFNCPRIVDSLNPLSVEDSSEALKKGRECIFRLANFCRKYLKGFENSYISNIADMLGVRVSSRIQGKYVYKIEDLKLGKKFKNPALISNYPVDVHSKDRNSSRLEKNGEYQLPIEALMSNDFDNLFIVGRGLSADYLSQGALRVQASCFSMGEAVAKYIKDNL